MFELRPNQLNMIEAILEAIAGGATHILVAAPTGFGKTVVYVALLQRLGLAARLVVPGVDLGSDLRKRLAEVGLYVPVCTPEKVLRETPSETGLLILDEVHNFLSPARVNVLNVISAQIVIGCSATPYRLDLEPLLSENGGPFQCFIEGPTATELTDQGYLANLIVETVGLEEVTTEFPVYRGTQFIGSRKVVTVEPADESDQVVDKYLARFNGQSAIAFCKSIEHAEQVCQDFCNAGVSAVTIHSRIARKEREYRRLQVASGEVLVLTVCQVGTEGIDIPRLKVAFMMRKIAKSMRVYVQGIGRILRVYEGQTAYALDLVGNFYRFGDPSEITAGDYAF